MNKFKKYCPNVWVAECEEEYEKGDVIQLETKYGKEVDCEVCNQLASKNGLFYYSVIKLEEKNYAERKAERYQNSAINHANKSNQYYQASQEASEFLSLGEPIKIGHHSEKRHRALIERNSKRMDKSMESYRNSEEAKHKAKYWEAKANEINLSMPESLDFYKYKLEKAKEYQTGLKNGTIEKAHSYSLAYATKDVKELNQKLEIAQMLWG
jgi:CO dehydrogenase/acetyl-CoA synthase alpha subunit